MSFDDRVRDALDRALADARARLERDLGALAAELVDADGLSRTAQALDAADSLRDVLHALLDYAAQHAGRAAVFLLVDGRGVRSWQLRGADAAALSAVAGDDAAMFPIVVGGQTVALLAIDRACRVPPAALEVLTRHAGRQLESMTLHKVLGLVPPSQGGGTAVAEHGGGGPQ